MKIRFCKYHGLGNDFIIIDGRSENISSSFIINSLNIKNLCDRNFGIGADGIILIQNSTKAANVKMSIFNSDGSEPEMCGNGIRCLVKYIFDTNKSIDFSKYNVETKAGILSAKIEQDNEVVISMGKPCFDPYKIPTLLQISKNQLPQGFIDIGDTCIEVSGVSMGNPHLVTVVDDLDSIPFQTWGPFLEKHDSFPSRTNVHFVQLVDKDNIKVKVWERGCGPTLACGTGACACVVVCSKLKYIESKTNVHLPGGRLCINWPNSDSPVFMKGPAEYVYSGSFNIFL